MATNTPLTLVVLAAGMGSRYGGLKQLDPVGPHGEVILDYSVHDALRAGVGRVVFVIRPDFEAAFRDTLGRRFESELDVRYVYQSLEDVPPGQSVPQGRQKPWGTGHAVLSAQSAVETPFIVINADDFYGAESYQSLAQHLRAVAPTTSAMEPVSMVAFPLRNTLSEHGSVARGLCRCNDAQELESVTEITNITKTPSGAVYRNDAGEDVDLTGDERVSMNMWGFLPSFFPLLEERFSAFFEDQGHSPTAEFYIPFAVDELIRQQRARARVLTTSSQWFGVTYQEDKPRVVQALQDLTHQAAYPSPLWTQAAS